MCWNMNQSMGHSWARTVKELPFPGLAYCTCYIIGTSTVSTWTSVKIAGSSTSAHFRQHKLREKYKICPCHAQLPYSHDLHLG